VNETSKRSLYVSLSWVGVAVAAVLILVWRLQLSFDLSLFLPSSVNFDQKILLKQMESGPGSRFILIGIDGQNREQLTTVSLRLRELLASEPEFVQVQNGLPPDEDTPLPSVIQNHRFVLTDLDFSQTTLTCRIWHLVVGRKSSNSLQRTPTCRFCRYSSD
jgi:predicted exporter